MSYIKITSAFLWENTKNNLNHFEDEGILHKHPKYMNDTGNNLKIKEFINFPMFETKIDYDSWLKTWWFSFWFSLAKMMIRVKGMIMLLLGKNNYKDENCDDNDDDIEDVKYPSLNCSESLGFWCVSSHRVEDVDQHQEQGHQQGHPTCGRKRNLFHYQVLK